MAIEAPYSKHKQTNLRIYIAICIGLMIWCVYDGYFNESFKKKHTDANGKPKGWLVVNRYAPPFLIGAAVLFGAYLFVVRNKKVIAGENELIIGDKERIAYDSIQKIDKTHFKSKGYFLVTYDDQNGREANRKISDKQYDNLKAILDHVVEEIS